LPKNGNDAYCYRSSICGRAFHRRFQTKNNNGEEKVKRIKQVIGDQKFDKIIAFGDTSGDKPMLAFAHESHYRFFN
jgi:phosphoserine phosphatase